MTIARTPIIDDDGTCTTGTIWNNAWKQEFYNQIDAMPSVGLWVPTDASGGGLALTVYGAKYAVMGLIVFIWGHVIYPSTADARPAIIGGLPFVNNGQFDGFYQTYGKPSQLHVEANTNYIHVLNPSTSINHPNNALSGGQLIFSGMYLRQ